MTNSLTPTMANDEKLPKMDFIRLLSEQPALPSRRADPGTQGNEIS